MRHEITKNDYELAINGDLREAFELMAQQTFYLDVLNVYSFDSDYRIVAALTKFNDQSGFYNMSCVYERNAETNQYAVHAAIENNEATVTYFAYDTLADAIAHANELLSTVTSAI